MAKKAANPLVRFRIDLSPTCSIGPGKIELLEAIRRTGSLRGAARELGFSYRRAWLLLSDLNTSFSETVTTPMIGGYGGGGARLTETGEQLVRCYRSTAEKIEPRVASLLKVIAAKAVLSSSKKPGAPRKRICRPLVLKGVVIKR